LVSCVEWSCGINEAAGATDELPPATYPPDVSLARGAYSRYLLIRLMPLQAIPLLVTPMLAVATTITVEAPILADTEIVPGVADPNSSSDYSNACPLLFGVLTIWT